MKKFIIISLVFCLAFPCLFGCIDSEQEKEKQDKGENANALTGDTETPTDPLSHYPPTSDPNEQAILEAYLAKHPNASYVWFDQYYGNFESGAIVALILCDAYGYSQAITETSFSELGIRIIYHQGNYIKVLYEDQFYGLNEAYEKGYLIAEDLYEIERIHKEAFAYLYIE